MIYSVRAANNAEGLIPSEHEDRLLPVYAPACGNDRSRRCAVWSRGEGQVRIRIYPGGHAPPV